MGFPWGAAVSAGIGLLGGNKSGGSSSGGSGRANTFSLSNPMFNVDWRKRSGPDDLSMALSGPMGGLFDQYADAASFMPAWLEDAGGLLSSQGMNMLGGLATTPEDVMRSQYGMISPLLEEGFERDRLALENRQFAQGRLGSTEGANDFGELLSSQYDARTKAMFDSLGMGLNTQNQMFNVGAGMLQLNPALRNAFQSLSSNNLNNLLNINNSMLESARVAGGIAGAGTGGSSSTGGGFNAGQALSSGFLNAGAEGLTDWLATV